MFDFTQHLGSPAPRPPSGGTPQREPIPGSTQVPNAAGGHAWPVDEWTRLDRFLVLGSEGGTYHVGERTLTRVNATHVAACLAADGPRVVRRVVEVSVAGRAPRNDPALFVLAMAAGLGDPPTRAAALEALPAVARTGTHLFHFLRYLKAFRGWGRGARTAVGRWYTRRAPRDLAYQVMKYQARDGWSHRDALRLAHPTPPTGTHDLLFRFATRGWKGVVEQRRAGAAGAPWADDVLESLEAMHAVRTMTPAEAARVIRIYGLTREMVPTEHLAHAVVWEALLDGMPSGAMVRNLGVMSKVGLLTPGSDAARTVVARLGDPGAIRRARLHPLALLVALRTYAQGSGMRGHGRWAPVAQVVDALDGALHLAFANVPSTGRRVLLALDVSGSMGAGVHGLPFVSCREAAAAMALVTAAAEPSYRTVAFTAGTHRSRWDAHPTGLCELPLSPRERLDHVVRRIAQLPFGGTDCALPVTEALRRRWAVDAFVVYTDSETWAGDVHPVQALREYRERTGIAAKLVVVAMASDGFTIADPDDAGMLDVVGFDTATPQVIADFLA